jgi:hypothetical protein
MTNPTKSSSYRASSAAGRLGVLALVLGLGGCASAFMSGSAPVSAPPKSPLAKWTVTACKDAAGAAIPMSGAISYYLEEGPEGLALYEMDAQGKGAKITNHWEDAQGMHFFTRVYTSHGFELFLPADRKQPGTRKVYLRGAFEVTKDANGVIRPGGAPGATCTMDPV